MGKKNLSKEQIDTIKKLHSKGMSLMEIAIEKKLSFWTVKYHLDEKYKQSVAFNNLNRNRAIAKNKRNGK